MQADLVYTYRLSEASDVWDAICSCTVKVGGAGMFFLIKLVLLPIWLPFKIIAEIVEHSGHRRHYRRRRFRLIWLPGRAGLARWSSDVMRTVGAAQQTPAQRFIVTPITVLAMILAWAALVYAWLLWWVLLVLAVPLMALA